MSGNTITLDYEYARTGFTSPAMGRQPVKVGELAPGNYKVIARFYDINRPSAAPQPVKTTLAVVPPQAYGVYSVPSQPRAYAPTSVLVRSAAYFNPASTLRTRLVRQCRSRRLRLRLAAAGRRCAAGHADLRHGAHAQGMAARRLHGRGLGSHRRWRADQKFFTTTRWSRETTPVVEYYSATLDHYFMSAGADEIALLDRGRQGDWKRTGFRFNAFCGSPMPCPALPPVCRFYASGPNSHFFTGNSGECDYLKALEHGAARQGAGRRARRFAGWAYEGIAFYALVPINGQCPS